MVLLLLGIINHVLPVELSLVVVFIVSMRRLLLFNVVFYNQKGLQKCVLGIQKCDFDTQSAFVGSKITFGDPFRALAQKAY